MHTLRNRRRRTTSPAAPAAPAPSATSRFAREGWISLVGRGSGFHDCPLCRELASQAAGAEAGSAGGTIEAIVGVNLETLPELMRSGRLDELIALVGPDATVQLQGRDLDSPPVEVISMADFLARLGYE